MRSARRCPRVARSCVDEEPGIPLRRVHMVKGAWYSAADELSRFAQHGSPFLSVGLGERRPFPEGPTIGCEGSGLTRADQLLHPIGGQLYDEVPRGALDACEERSVMAETGIAHHRAGGHAGLFQERVGELPEERLAPLRRSAILSAGRHAASPSALYATRYPVAASQ